MFVDDLADDLKKYLLITLNYSKDNLNSRYANAFENVFSIEFSPLCIIMWRALSVVCLSDNFPE